MQPCHYKLGKNRNISYPLRTFDIFHLTDDTHKLQNSEYIHARTTLKSEIEAKPNIQLFPADFTIGY